VNYERAASNDFRLCAPSSVPRFRVEKLLSPVFSVPPALPVGIMSPL